MTSERYTYTIEPRPDRLGGGWRLRLLDGEEEMGGGVFPMPNIDANEMAVWWDQLDDAERAEWLERAASKDPWDAYRAFLLAEEFAAAEAEAYAWLDSRDD